MGSYLVQCRGLFSFQCFEFGCVWVDRATELASVLVAVFLGRLGIGPTVHVHQTGRR